MNSIQIGLNTLLRRYKAKPPNRSSQAEKPPTSTLLTAHFPVVEPHPAAYFAEQTYGYKHAEPPTHIKHPVYNNPYLKPVIKMPPTPPATPPMSPILQPKTAIKMSSTPPATPHLTPSTTPITHPYPVVETPPIQPPRCPEYPSNNTFENTPDSTPYQEYNAQQPNRPPPYNLASNERQPHQIEYPQRNQPQWTRRNADLS